MLGSQLKRTILLGALLLPLGAPADDTFSEVFVFGDSLSDTGNLAAATMPFPPPFFMGSRVSDGAVGVEYLAADRGLTVDPPMQIAPPFVVQGTNFAVAGARAGGNASIDLPFQVGAFLMSQAGHAPPGALYVVFIGSNDVPDARDRRDARDVVDDAIDAIDEAMWQLAIAGAETFLVVNAPDIGSIPETRILADRMGDRQFAKRATQLARRFNRKLHKVVRGVENAFDVDVVEFDLFRFVRVLRANGDALGYDNVDDGCFLPFTVQPPQPNPGCVLATGELNFAGFFFFDEIHPSGKTHALVGAGLSAAVGEDNGDEEDGEDEDG